MPPKNQLFKRAPQIPPELRIRENVNLENVQRTPERLTYRLVMSCSKHERQDEEPLWVPRGHRDTTNLIIRGTVRSAGAHTGKERTSAFCPLSRALTVGWGPQHRTEPELTFLEEIQEEPGCEGTGVGRVTGASPCPRALTFPPPGWCFRFSVEPILDLTFFRSGMGTGAVCRRLLAEDGDLGGVRTTATFLGSRVGGVGRDGVRERLPGVPGEPGLL